MVKPTPNPPESETESTTADRHLNPAILKNSAPPQPQQNVRYRRGYGHRKPVGPRL